MKYFIGTVIAVVVAAIVVGVVIVGSPQNKRAERFDEQRVSDLQGIQWQIQSYWQSKGTLPSMLTDLNNDLQGYRVPLDPQNQEAYVYETTGDTSFRLCATFVKENPENMPRYAEPVSKGGLSEIWGHGAGYACFDRTIDKDLYPPTPVKE